MLKPLSAFAALALMAVAGGAAAQQTPYAAPEVPQGRGPHPAVMESEPGLPTHTVYRPANLAALAGAKLPIVAFGNGGCTNIGNRFRYFLTEIASNGFLAIAIGPIGPKEVESSIGSSGQFKAAPAPGSPAALLLQGAAPQKPVDGVTEGATRPAPTTAAQLREAIDWAIAENSRPGGKYEGRIDTAKVAVMGQSCGGLQAIDAAYDPRVTTLVVWNSGVFPIQGRSWELAAANVEKADLATLHGSALYVTGDTGDVAFPQAEDDYERIQHMPVFRAWREKTGHSGTYREPYGGAYSEVAVGWLQWRLKGDPQAARMFSGQDCGLCRNPEWHVKSKKM